MTVTPPALRSAVRDGILTPDKAVELTPYFDAAAPHGRLTQVTKFSTKVGAWIGMAFAAMLVFAIVAGLITVIVAGLVGVWRWIFGG